ncbi:hypothetical protein M3J09_012037 [Ascochyta lentis]
MQQRCTAGSVHRIHAERDSHRAAGPRFWNNSHLSERNNLALPGGSSGTKRNCEGDKVPMIHGTHVEKTMERFIIGDLEYLPYPTTSTRVPYFHRRQMQHLGRLTAA